VHRFAHGLSRLVACAHALPVAKEQEEQVVGADPEQDDDQQRGERLVDREADLLGEQSDQRGGEDVDDPNGTDRQKRRYRAAEDQAEQHDDQQDRRTADHLAGRGVGIARVLVNRGAAGQSRLQTAALQEPKRLAAQRFDCVLDRLALRRPVEADLDELDLAVRGELRVRGRDRGHARDSRLLEVSCECRRLLLVGGGQASAVGAPDDEHRRRTGALRKDAVGELLRLHRLGRSRQKARFVRAGDRGQTRGEWNDHRQSGDPERDYFPWMCGNEAAEAGEHEHLL
jgi:hypothetical protein